MAAPHSQMVAEGIILGAIDGFGIGFRVEGAESDPFGPDWFGDRRIHVDQHVIGTADVTIAHIFKQSLWFFCLADMYRHAVQSAVQPGLWRAPAMRAVPPTALSMCQYPCLHSRDRRVPISTGGRGVWQWSTLRCNQPSVRSVRRPDEYPPQVEVR